jgi:membrane protease YdiL (CAAX protease family)
MSQSRSKRVARAGIFLLLAFPLVVVAYQGLPLVGYQLPPIARASIIAVILAYFTQTLLRRQGQSLPDYRVSFSWCSSRDLLVGFAAGFVLFGIGMVSLRAALPFEWVFGPAVSLIAIISVTCYHLVTGACEELAWRGFAFDCLIRSIGFWPSQLVVALVAACFHVVCGWRWDVALVSTTAGSVLFGLVFFRWRSLPAAVGVHSAWNWTRDLFFGPATAASVFTAHGTDTWTSAQWNVAQGILVAVTLGASIFIATRMAKHPSRNAQTA